MPRLPIRTDPNTERIRRQLREYVRGARGRERELERTTKVKQYTINRFVNGRTKRLSQDLRTVCEYAGIEVIPGINRASDDSRLQAALARVWDGREETAELLAILIETVGPLLLSTTKRSHAVTRSEKRPEHDQS